MPTTEPPGWAGAVSSSARGDILITVTSSGSFDVSTNSGLTWVSKTLPYRGVESIATSTDGTKLAAAVRDHSIYVSTNLGTTWRATRSGVGSWFSIACSADGTKLIASGDATYTSTNFGDQWLLASTNAGYVASSADGTKLIIAGTRYAIQNLNRSIYTSDNSGITWVSNNAPSSGWSCVAPSADGSTWAAIADYSSDENDRGIWIGRTTPSPHINMTKSGNNLMLSWLVPSTNFIVQQNSDLMAANWVSLTNSPSFEPLTLQNQLVLAPSNAWAYFFRLSAQ